MHRDGCRLFDVLFQNRIVNGWEKMPSWVFVDRRAKSSDVDALLYPSAKPVFLCSDDLKIGFSKVVILVTCVLHNGRFTLAGAAKSGGKMLIYS